MFKMILHFLALALCVVGSLAVPTPINNDSSLRIITGTVPDPLLNEHPFVVLLYYSNNFVCAGTLVTFKHVMTAAHCVFIHGIKKTSEEPTLPPTYLGKFKIVVGTHKREEIPLAADLKNVDDIDIHRDYNPINIDENKIMHFDIAILTVNDLGLPTPDTCTDKICPLDYKEPFAPAKSLILYGWGSTKPGGEFSEDLLKTKLNQVADAECKTKYNGKDQINNVNQICAWTPTREGSICYGDSGGPLVGEYASDPAKPTLVGIASWGTPCGRKEKPDVFTKVKAPVILAWIKTIIEP